ncbi:MAG: coproporphyrinogen-III oxidase family protein [Candidatus Cryptobacteroides sp.]|nr:coproporphyrinogen III oxidase family protein [Bacteroidales bacterium]MDY2773791.1 coproporphyrinogen-III oxidase family protein [Candidatus Cryptobacteroides sp.]
MIYVHIPFCKSFCTYCGFYSETSACYDRYVEALLGEIDSRKSEFDATMDVNTLYIGGGTPSVMPLPLLCRVVEALKDESGSRNFDEFTVELNPEDVIQRGEAYAEALLGMGVTRASMGVQSFDDAVLRWMNRRHDAETAVRAYRILEKSGFRNISIDLIFGLPELGPDSQTRHSDSFLGHSDSQPKHSDFLSGRFTGHRGKDGYVPLLDERLWRETILRALDISASGMLPSHISAYQLSVEPDSALDGMIADGRCRETSEESCARQYEILCEELSAAGYHHYEISNFALPGMEARHNSAYWRHVPYVGLGPGAHSLSILPDGHRCRSWNSPDLKLYLETFAPLGQRDTGCSGQETLSPVQLGIENVMLGLRTSLGCPLPELVSACDRARLDSAISSGRLVPVPGSSELSGLEDGAAQYYRIPEKYFFISDGIISELL